jgi:hypothetical protein
MSNFKGRNDLGARDLFNYRSIYDGYALPAAIAPVAPAEI